MVSKRFDFGTKGPTVVKNFLSDWKMTWSDTTIKSPSIIFEICNFLFNYIIMNFNQAAMFLGQKQGVDQYKQALQKLQSVRSKFTKAVWGSQELLRYNVQLQNTMKLPLEYRPSTLEFMNALMTGMAYMCIFNILVEGSPGKVPDESLAGLEREISNHFYIVKDVVKTDPQLKKIFGYLLEDVLSKYYEFGINCLVRVANSFEKQHEEAKSKGFNGIQIGYLQEALNLLKNMDKESFADKKMLKAKYEPLRKRVDDLILMNNEVYKAKIPSRDQLTDIKPIETKVRPLEPKNIRIPPKDAEYFSAFSSPEMENVKSSLSLFISNKKQHVEKTMFDLKERMTELNRAYNIPYLKSLASMGNISPDVEKKVQAIRQLGDKAFIAEMDKVAQNRGVIESCFTSIDQLVQRESQKDSEAMKIAQNSNFATFGQSFSDQFNKIGEIKSGYRSYHAIEQKCHSEFDKFKGYLSTIANPSVSIAELTSNPEMDSFMQENKESLMTLKKYADGVDMLVNQHMKSDMDRILAALAEIDIEKYANRVLTNETNIEQIYKHINENLGPMVMAFEEKVTKVLTPMDKVKDAAQSVPTPRVTQTNANDILLAVDFFSVNSC
jgi:hypothetical protein